MGLILESYVGELVYAKRNSYEQLEAPRRFQKAGVALKLQTQTPFTETK